MTEPQKGVIQRVPVVPSPIAGKFTFPANKATPNVPIPVMVQRPHTAPARVEVMFGVSRKFRGTEGTLEESGHTVSIRWFDKAKGGTAVLIPPTGLTIKAADLNKGFHLFAESNVPSESVGDYVLTLVLIGGPDPLATPPASVGLTAVRLTLDVFPPGPTFGAGVPAPMPEPPATAPPAGTATDKWFLGRTVNVQDAALSQGRGRIRVRQVEPFDFAGNLSLRQRALSGTTFGRDSARCALFDDDNPPGPGLPPTNVVLPNPLVFPAPGILGRDLFAEGRALSAARRDVGFQLGLEGGEPDGDRVAFTVGVGGSITIGNPLRVVLVKKAPANTARQTVTLKTGVPFAGTGSFDVTAGNTPTKVQFFAAAAGGAALPLPIVAPGARLSSAAGFQLFVEGVARSASVDELVLTLTLSGGANPAGLPATTKMTAVELTLDFCAPRTTPRAQPVPLAAALRSRPGRTVQVREADNSHQRAKLIVREPSPNLFTDLVIEAVGQGGPSRLEMFFDEDPTTGQPALVSPRVLSFVLLDANGLPIFVEGVSASTGVRDTSIRLGIPGLDPEGDRIDTSVYGDLSVAGPFPVGEKNYARAALFPVAARSETLGDLTAAEIGAPIGTTVPNTAFDVLIRGLIRYPATAGGANTPASTLLDSYPLVILAHGNHVPANGARVNSHDGLEYLARHLASYGYVAASVDLEDMNYDRAIDPLALNNRDLAIVQRGLTILEHIAEMETLNGADPQLTGRIDLGRIGLVGHSRGGEGVVSAEVSNRAVGGPGRNVQSVTSIAPTDFLGLVPATTPYLVVYGSSDNDVASGHGFQLYDRATLLKSMIFIEGAIHNRFSTNFDWLANLDSEDPRMISEDDHRNIARAYALGWTEMAIRGQRDHLPLFDRNGRPASVAAAVAIFHQFQQVGAQRAVIDNFEQGAFDLAAPPLGPQLAARAAQNTLGGAVAVAGLVIPVGLTAARTEASLRRRELANFCHDTFGGMVAWTGIGGTYTTPFGAGNISTFRVLSFRAAQRFGVPRNPSPGGVGLPGLAPGATLDLTVRLTDSAGRAARVRAGTVATIPFPWKRLRPGDLPPIGPGVPHPGEGGEALNKSALRTIRLPLSAFKAANNSIDLTAVVSIVFELDQRATGELAIDDIEFSD